MTREERAKLESTPSTSKRRSKPSPRVNSEEQALGRKTADSPEDSMLSHFHPRLQQSVGFGFKSRSTDGKVTLDGNRFSCKVPDRDA